MARTSSSERVHSADGTPIAYRVTGSGPPLVLVHGAATWGAEWLPLVPLLKDRFTLASLDRRGRGDSGDSAFYAMEREAEDVLAVLDDVGGDRILAHSYGALCSMLAAARTGPLRRMVLYEPPIAMPESDARAIAGLVARGRHEEALEGFLRGAGAPEAQLGAIMASAAWPRLLETVPTLPRELLAASRWRPPGGPLDVDALFLLGGDTTSRSFLDGLDDLRARFPRSRLETIPGQQHIAHVFAPEAFAGLVCDFLGS